MVQQTTTELSETKRQISMCCYGKDCQDDYQVRQEGSNSMYFMIPTDTKGNRKSEGEQNSFTCIKHF